MTRSPAPSPDDEYIMMLTSLIEEIGAVKAELFVEELDYQPYKFDFEIRPTNKEADSIFGTILEDGMVELKMGSTDMKIPPKNGYGSKSQLEYMREICEAVISGNAKETTFSVRQKILGVLGVFQLANRTVKVWSQVKLSPYWIFGKRKFVRQFQPYSPSKIPRA